MSPVKEAVEPQMEEQKDLLRPSVQSQIHGHVQRMLDLKTIAHIIHNIDTGELAATVKQIHGRKDLLTICRIPFIPSTTAGFISTLPAHK